MGKWISAFFLLVSVLWLSACGPAGPKEEKPPFLRMEDSAGRTVTLDRQPERVILLSPSFINIWEAAGGDFIAWADSPLTDVPEGAEGKETVGYLYQVNVEKTVSLRPDLVVGLNGLHNRLVPALESSGISVILLSLSDYGDVQETLRLFAQMTGKPDKGKEAAAALEASMEKARRQAPDVPVTAAVVHSTAGAVTSEIQKTIASDCLEQLHVKNVMAEKINPSAGKRPPVSLEILAESDPGVIFITSMGTDEQVENQLRAALTGQPAWRELKAVRTGHVYALPDELFLVNPGMNYPEALSFMAEKLNRGAVSAEKSGAESWE